MQSHTTGVRGMSDLLLAGAVFFDSSVVATFLMAEL